MPPRKSPIPSPKEAPKASPTVSEKSSVKASNNDFDLLSENTGNDFDLLNGEQFGETKSVNEIKKDITGRFWFFCSVSF